MDSQFHYCIDHADRLIVEDDAWDRFALENDAAHLISSVVNGKSIWKFITGSETRHLYDLVLQKIRATNQSITIPFRCDSCALLRYMNLTLKPLEGGGIAFCTTITNLKHRENQMMFEASSGKSSMLIKMCSMCKKIKIADDNWLELEEAMQTQGYMEVKTPPQISHGLCPICYKITLETINQI